MKEVVSCGRDASGVLIDHRHIPTVLSFSPGDGREIRSLMALALRREGSLVFRALSRHETTALTALKAETRDDTKKEDATTQRQSRLDRQPRQKDDTYDSSPHEVVLPSSR